MNTEITYGMKELQKQKMKTIICYCLEEQLEDVERFEKKEEEEFRKKILQELTIGLTVRLERYGGF